MLLSNQQIKKPVPINNKWRLSPRAKLGCGKRQRQTPMARMPKR